MKTFALQIEHLLRGIQLDGDVRVRLVPQRQARQQPALRERRQHGDVDAVRGAGGRCGGGAHAVVKAVEGGLHRLQQRSTGGIQHDAPPPPVEQCEAELLFQSLDLLADGAVGQVQFFGRSAQVGQARHGAEGRQGAQRKACHAGKHS